MRGVYTHRAGDQSSGSGSHAHSQRQGLHRLVYDSPAPAAGDICRQ